VFLHRDRLAGQDGLIDLEVDRLDQPQVRRHPIPGVEDHYVPRHQLPRGDPLLHALPEDGGHRRSHPTQRLQGPLRAVFLDEAEQDGEEDDDHDDHRLRPMAQDDGEGGGGQEDQHQDVPELGEEDGQGRDAPGGLQLVGAPFPEPAGRLLPAQPRRPRAQPLETLFDR